MPRHLLARRQRGVLDRHLVGGVSDCVRDVHVDAADVVGTVVVDLLTLRGGAEWRRVALGQKVRLVGQLRVTVSSHLRDRAVLVNGGLRRPDELRKPGPSNMPQGIHHEQAVVRSRVADAELRVRPSAAVDVRDPKALVPDDVGAIVRRREGLHLADVRHGDGEARVLVIAAERRRLHSRRDLLEVEVHRQLVRLVRRGAVRGRASLSRGGQPVVAGGQDVQDLAL